MHTDTMKHHKNLIRTTLWYRLAIVVLFLLVTVGFTPNVYAQAGDKTITFSATDQPLNQMLSILGDTFGVGVVASKGAQGNLNVSLTNATLEQALDSITQPNGWVWVRKENTVTIFTKPEYDEYMKGNVITKTFYILNTNAQEVQNTIQPLVTTAGKIIRDDRTNLLQVTDTPESLARIEQVIQTLDVPIEVEVIPLKYATASDVKTQADKIKTAKGEIQVDERTNILIVTDVPSAVEKIKALVLSLDVETKLQVFDIKYAKVKDIQGAIKDLLTKRGYTQIDDRNGKLVVDDIPSHLEKVAKVIAALDEPDRLVYIEAEIVDMDYQKSLELGVDWSYGASYSLSNSSSGSVIIPITNGKFQDNIKNFFSGITSQVGFNLNATAKAISKLGANTELLASPRILVKSDEEAEFLVGGTQPYTVLYTQPITGTTGTSYQQYYSQVSQEYGIKLKVKPHINADGVVEIKVSLENTSADPVTLAAGSSNAFSGVKTTTSKANSIIQVHNNETVILGGMVTRSKTESGSGIPWLEDIPIFGPVLFGSRSKGNSKRNLLLFITPHITSGRRMESEKLYPESYKAYSNMTTEEPDKSKKGKDAKKKAASNVVAPAQIPAPPVIAPDNISLPSQSKPVTPPAVLSMPTPEPEQVTTPTTNVVIPQVEKPAPKPVDGEISPMILPNGIQIGPSPVAPPSSNTDAPVFSTQTSIISQ